MDSMGDKIIPYLLIFWLLSSDICSNGKTNAKHFNVMHHGALGDGIANDSRAFLMAWNAACSSRTSNPTIIVPERKTFLVHPISFRGPCKAENITFLISGEIVGPTSPRAWEGLDASEWLAFSGIHGLNIVGSGRISGMGSGWWNQSCRDHPGLKGCTSLAPTALKISSCNASSVRGVSFINSPQTHILIIGCDGVGINHVDIKAPESSPNTDGIHIQSSRNIEVSNSKIGTGDDCVSIGDYTSNIKISQVKCGPGHGISIGSLGGGGNFVEVENIYVSKVNFTNTTNGARIKTWQVGKGYVRDVTFEQLYFDSVENPVIIDQNYCNIRGACKEQPSGVHVAHVKYSDLYGTSLTPKAITLNCSRYVACSGLWFKNIRIISAKHGAKVTSTCINAHGFAFGTVQPKLCLTI